MVRFARRLRAKAGQRGRARCAPGGGPPAATAFLCAGRPPMAVLTPRVVAAAAVPSAPGALPACLSLAWGVAVALDRGSSVGSGWKIHGRRPARPALRCALGSTARAVCAATVAEAADVGAWAQGHPRGAAGERKRSAPGARAPEWRPRATATTCALQGYKEAMEWFLKKVKYSKLYALPSRCLNLQPCGWWYHRRASLVFTALRAADSQSSTASAPAAPEVTNARRLRMANGSKIWV